MNITKAVFSYIDEHPGIKECIKKNLINYSKLSRQISADLSVKKSHFDAVLIACRRYSDTMKKSPSYERDIKDILKRTKLEISTKVLVAVLDKEVHYKSLLLFQTAIKKMNETVNIIEGSSAITVITSQEFMEKLQKSFNNHILKVSTQLVAIKLKHPTEMETTPGVVAFIYSKFGEKGVNILETLSCWTDTIFVVEEKDMDKAISAINFR